MKQIYRIALLLSFAFGVRAQDEAASEAALKEEAARIPVVREAIRKTALIEAKASGKNIPMGSGAVVSADGYVVTCAHVSEGLAMVAGAEKALQVVLSDGRRREATIVGTNSTNDIALLKVDAEKLPHFDLSADPKAEAGDWAIALGYPAGNVGSPMDKKGDASATPSVALGKVVDPKRRFLVQSLQGAKYYPDCLESDVPIFMGNSGGPLVNAKGELLGLNAAISRNGRSFTLSAASIVRCYEAMKAGKEVHGEKFQEEMKWEDYGRVLWDTLGWSGGGGPEREYLREPFERMAEARRGGVLPVYRGEDRVGSATVLDAEGRMVASATALDRKGIGFRIMEAMDKGVAGDPTLKDLWDKARGLFGKETPLEVRLPSGRRVPAVEENRSAKFGLVLLKVDAGDEKLEPIPVADGSSMEPGRWVAALDGGKAAAAVGILSSPKHSVDASMRFPLSVTDWVDAWLNDELKPKEYIDILLFDARLGLRQLGAPLCDGRGKMIGIALFHPCRGVSYAAPIAEVRNEFGLKK